MRRLLHENLLAGMDVDACRKVIGIHLAAHEVVVVVVLYLGGVDIINSGYRASTRRISSCSIF